MDSTELPSYKVLIPFFLTCFIALLLYFYTTRNFKYWEKKGIPFFKPFPFSGNLNEVITFQKNIGHQIKDIYDRTKGYPFKGFFMYDQPVLMVRDLDLLKSILLKDFQHFTDKGITLSKADALFGEALFSLKGKRWKKTRTKLSPGFSSSKLKSMFKIVEEKAKIFDTYFDEASKSGSPVPIKDTFARFTTDIVASFGFGIESNTMKNPNSEFRNILKHAFLYSKIGALKFIAAFVDLPLFKWFPLSTSSPEAVAFFQDCVHSVIKDRQNNPDRIVRHDYMDLLLQIADNELKSEDTDAIDFNIVSQAFTFLAAGFETTSTTLTYAMYHLALDSMIQDKLRLEIQESVTETNGELSYETLQKVEYLKMVISETLRLYPSMPLIDRTCTLPYTIPGSNIVIDKGVFVYSSILGIHKDPDIYPNPEVFDPERFSEENKNKRHKFAYIPFGEGPRVCIGKRMAILVLQIALSHILLNYEVLPSKETPKKLHYDLRTFLLIANGEIPLIFRKLK